MTWRRTRVLLAAAACLLGALAPSAHAALLTNGDFEVHPNTDASTTTFTGWTESVGTAAVVAATPLAGTSSTRFVAGTGGVQQDLLGGTNTFTFSAVLAAIAPANNASDRTLNLFLQETTGGGQVNFRVIRSADAGTQGDVQVYNGTAFVTILSDVVNFSTDLATPVTNTLSISGTFNDGPTSSYVVTVNGNSSTSRNEFQGGAGQPSNFARFLVATTNGTNTDFVLDSVVAVPEPASAAALALAAVPLVLRRRQRA